MDMVSGIYLNDVPALGRARRIRMATVDAAVRRVLRAKAALGLFEDPYHGSSAQGRLGVDVNDEVGRHHGFEGSGLVSDATSERLAGEGYAGSSTARRRRAPGDPVGRLWKEAMVRRKPSSKSTTGSYPISSRAFPIAARDSRTSPGR